MSFRLIETGWNTEIMQAVAADGSCIQIICPFIKRGVVERLVSSHPTSMQVITRFNLADFSEKVSDIEALRLLLKAGATIRGIRNLHAKVYLFGTSRAIVTSANLTDAGLSRNHEFGFVTSELDIINKCRTYFDSLWKRAGEDLTPARIAAWEDELAQYLGVGGNPSSKGKLQDDGVDAGIPADSNENSDWFAESGQAFVKFFGVSNDRADPSLSIEEEVRRAGCHWACTYPKGKRPRQVQEGATMFMGRLVMGDIIVFGRAVALRSHAVGSDDATSEDIEKRKWKKDWPHYIRVHHAEFIDGTLRNGISLNRLMQELGSNAFLPTQRNAKNDEGNTDPRRSLMRKPAMELTGEGQAWLNQHVEHAFAAHGKLPASVMAALDWPKVKQ